MDSLNKEHLPTEDKLSLKEVILNVQDFFGFLLRKWIYIVCFAGIGAAAGFFYASSQKFNYAADLSFILEENSSGSMGLYAGLASQYGIELGNSGGNGLFSGDNIMEFLRSRMMIRKTLLSDCEVNGKQRTLADFYLDIYGFREKWEGRPDLQQLHFDAPAGGNFTVKQDSVLNELYILILKKNLVVNKPDKKLSFIHVKCKSLDPLFSRVFVERLVKEATDFYVETKTKRSKSNVNKLQAKADSLESLLNKKTYSAAAAQDLNLNPARSVARVTTEVATRDKVVLQTMYAEVVKNLEVSRMAMSNETPIIQIIDVPMNPLKKERLGRMVAMIVGGILAGVVVVLYFSIRKLYKQIMN